MMKLTTDIFFFFGDKFKIESYKLKELRVKKNTFERISKQK